MSKLIYFLKHGVKNIFAHRLMSAASICIIAASLALLGLLVAAGINVNAIMGRIGDSYEINVYIKDGAGGETLSDIEGTLKAIKNVREVRYFSREDRMEKVSYEVYGDEGYVFGDGDNPLRDSFILVIDDLTESDRVAANAAEVTGVDEVIRNEDIVSSIEMLTGAVRSIGLWIMIILLLLSMFIVYNTIRLSLAAYAGEIRIMRIVGASGGFIVGPFVVQGFLLGLCGAFVATVVIAAGYGVVAARITEVVSPQILSLVGLWQVMSVIAPIFVGCGSLIGVLGSIAAAKGR